jgi:precorrin-6A/cobalt-precorrin-6A reductase
VRILILGGTGEARALAAAMAGRPGLRVVSSLAGRVSNPALPAGEVRIGGFGGVEGLVGYLRQERVDAVVDATHPFAATITRNAVAAAARVGLPLVVLRRPAWPVEPGWIKVPGIAEAARQVAGLPPGCVFVTTGRRDLAAFAGDDSHHYLVRAVEPPDGAMPPRVTVLLDRGPYTVDGEAALMREHAVTALVTKNSGGDLTVAKLVAARERGIPVVVVDRPAVPAGPPVLETVEAVLSWLESRLSGTDVG